MVYLMCVFFFKQKTAYEMRISDWSSDVCSSDLVADVYSVEPHVGRGGWTWYTGSGAWLYRAGLEAILGFYLQGDKLRLDPCIPRDWPGFSIEYRHGGSRYVIEIANPHGARRGIATCELDGSALEVEPCLIPLSDDGGAPRVVIALGDRQSTRPK